MKSLSLNTRLIEFIRKERAVTTSEVAEYFKVSWNTADKYLLEVMVLGKVIRLKKKGVNIWLLK